ncbi:MAG: hypothetical protein QM726_21610 [Chitinophagaceae bacterium]
MRLITTILILVLIAPCADAQQMMKGKVYDKITDSVMGSTSIYNATQKKYALSNKEGDYNIAANEGDKLIFTSVGYMPDTVKVLNYMIDAGYDETLSPKMTTLKNVTVSGANYVDDSLSRREDYAAFYNKSKKQLVSKTGPQNGVGIAISPIGFLSKRHKDRKMKENLQYQEEQDFVDYAFNRRYIERLTHLHGDSLLNFMLTYRPTYEFCRMATDGDMLNYINEKYILYMKKEDPADNKKKKK